MRSRRTLRQWIGELLPQAGSPAQHCAWELVRALMLGFTVQLSQLARQLDHDTTAKAARQRLDRWLNREHWEPSQIYGQLLHRTARLFRGRQQVLLLIDCTTLGDAWQVLQVSIPFQRRALPLFRLVRPCSGAAVTQREMLAEALHLLHQYHPALRHRAVLIMDRGFPSHDLVQWLRRSGWRYAVRVKDKWKMTHPEYTGLLRHLKGITGEPRFFRDALLGDRTKGERSRVRHCHSHVVVCRTPGAKEAWCLLTSETDAELVVELYRQRMQIECEFRDLKGPLGLDHLAEWEDADRIARFLAWMAVYEWRLAYLWLWEHLEEQRKKWRVGGTLSWIRVTRLWLQHLLRTGAFQPDACL